VCGGQGLDRALHEQALRLDGPAQIRSALRDVCTDALRHRALI